MSKPEDISLPLRLQLYKDVDALPSSPRVKSLGDSGATVRLGVEQIDVDIALPAASRAEQRYVVDQVLRKASGLVGFDAAELRGTGVSDDTLITIGLDLELVRRSAGHRLRRHRRTTAPSIPRAERLGR